LQKYCKTSPAAPAGEVGSAGQRFRVLGVIDSFTRQCLALEVATRFPSRRVTRVLERAIAAYGKPQSIRSDNGPELTSRHYLAWAIEWKIDLLHIQPGKSTQNGGMETGGGSTLGAQICARTRAGLEHVAAVTSLGRDAGTVGGAQLMTGVA